MTIVENGEVLRSEPKGNYEATRFNALKHALLSQYTVLPWESQDDYQRLLEALVAEHDPKGPTEEHWNSAWKSDPALGVISVE
jgi:hypothetical protein